MLFRSKAFPSGDEGAAPVSPGGTETSVATSPTSPPPTSPAGDGGGGGNGGSTEEPRDPSEVELQVLNGTDVAGLADETRQVLEDAGYKVLTIGNAQGTYETTQITYLRKARADAEALAEQFFPGAQLETATPDTQVDITVILGDDYAAADEQAPEESPS